MAQPLTAERLRALLDYDPVSGVFRHKVTRGRAKAGEPAGTLGNDGYRRIWVDGKSYAAHRLAWLFVHRTWPRGKLDHKNRGRDVNGIENLRPATRSQNKANSIRQRNNSTGHKGVVWFPRRKKFQATISKNKRRHFLGYFDTAEEAHAAYCRAGEQLQGEFFSP